MCGKDPWRWLAALALLLAANAQCKGRARTMKARVTSTGRLRIAAWLAAVAFVLALLAPLGVNASPQQPASVTPSSNVPAPWQAPRTVYISNTGQSLDGVFLDFWRANNGIANYGYPITPEVQEHGHIVQ